MSATITAPAPGTYQLDVSRSNIAFTTRHLFGLSGVQGTFALRDGNVTIAEPLSASHLVITADARSFDTATPKRDTHVRSQDWLNVNAHPAITFTGERLEQKQQGWTLRGTLNAAGTPAPLSLQVQG